MNLKNLSNVQLHQQTQMTAEKERLTTIELLWHLRENEKRMLYAQMGYRDLKEYCVKELKLSEGSAWRRISAMRLLQEIPEIETKIKSGDLNITQISMARAHFREVKVSNSEKHEILFALENQSTRTTERILAENRPEDLIANPEVIEKPLRGQKLEVTLILDESLQKELEEIQILLGKTYSKLELLRMLAKEKLQVLKQDLNKKRKAEAPVVRNAQSAPNENSTQSRYISRGKLSEIKRRDQHHCQFLEPLTGRQCSARTYLQVEHRTPYAKGGLSNLENLQLLCSNHNRLRAVQQFGKPKMKVYVPQIK